MMEIIKAQGEKERNPDKIKIGKLRYEFKANKSGTVKYLDNNSISRIARSAGAPLDASAGVYFHKHVKDRVKKGEKILTIYTENKQKLSYVIDVLKKTDGVIIR